MKKIRSRFLALLCVPVFLLGSSGCGLVGRTVGLAIPVALAVAPIKLIFTCIPEGTPIDTPSGPRPIESIRPGDEVIGFSGRSVRVQQKHGYSEDPAGERFREIEFHNGAIVRLCDMHRIDGIRSMNVKPGDEIGGKFVKSVENFGGVERSYDLMTEDEGYRISGLPVNSMIEEMYEAGRNGVESIRE